WSTEEKEVTVKQSKIAGINLAPFPFEDEKDWSEFTPKATLEYNFDAGMVYLTYARGFKSGGYNYAATNGAGLPLEPEILDMLEFGWKTELLDGLLRFNGAAYYYDYQDLQVTRAVAGPGDAVIQTTENAANATIMVLDIDLTWLATELISITMVLNLMDSEYEDYEASAQVFNTRLTGNPNAPGMGTVLLDADGEKMLRTSDWSGFISAKFDFQAGDGRMPLVVTYSYKDDYDYDFIGDPLSEGLRQDGFGLLNARLSYHTPSESWVASLWGKNLTAEDDYFDDIVANPSGLRASHGAPRTYGIDLTYYF
ncbi:MAG: TonB-dependent receptor domain-containing protein, partial [Parahaliea sp.]